MKGGNEKVVPIYREPVNSPFISNEQREITKNKYAEAGKKTDQEPQPMVNLQIYEPHKQFTGLPDPSKTIASAMPLTYFPPQLGMAGTGLYQNQPIAVTKTYRIDASGPHVDHAKLAYVYEDVLPQTDVRGTINTIGERLNIHNYVRAIVFGKGDGKCIDLSGSDPNGLLSHIKFMNLNPYNTYRFSSNPYMGLPDGFLIYRSCYPIRHDTYSNTVSCAKGSIGSNIRIYKLTNEEYNVNLFNNGDLMNYNAWREIAYYEYIKEYVIKRSQCPNFVIMYGYYINDNSNINFDQIAIIKGKNIRNEPSTLAMIDTTNKMTNSMMPNMISQTIPNTITNPIMSNTMTNSTLQNNTTSTMESAPSFISPIMSGGGFNSIFTNNEIDPSILAKALDKISSINDNKKPISLKDAISSSSNNLVDNTSSKNVVDNTSSRNLVDNMSSNNAGNSAISNNKINYTPIPTTYNNCHLGPCIDTKYPTILYSNPKAYTGKIILSITESPLSNIYNWASKIYQAEGNIRRMIHTGFHSEAIWNSILFQIMSALYTLQIHGIVFNNFDVESNIYIKESNTHANSNKYWKYKVDGIDYYVPNYGFVAMFDSSFRDIDDNCGSIIDKQKHQYKISGKIFNDNMSESDIQNSTFSQFTRTFNNNVFSDSFVDQGGCKPPESIIRLLDNITNHSHDDNSKDIGRYFYLFMRHYMNNRIGTYLKDTEVLNIRKNDVKEFKKGNIIVHEISSDTYKFVMHHSQVSPGLHRVLTKQNNDYIESDVPISVLYNYSKVEPIIQNYKINESGLSEDQLLETYIINKN